MLLPQLLQTKHADLIIRYIQENSLSVEWILETHVHADHLTASQYLKQVLGWQNCDEP